MSEWQPIETAPKDRTRILLLEEWGAMVVGWWGKDGTCTWEQWVYGEGSGKFGDEYSSMVKPTHWMPLPRPPKKL